MERASQIGNKVLLAATLGLTLDRFPFIIRSNCCINEIRRTDAGYVVKAVNQTAHMPEQGLSLLEKGL